MNLHCLNPCFSGTYSRSWEDVAYMDGERVVLILVLVEHTLGGIIQTLVCLDQLVLILVLVEHTLGDLDVYPRADKVGS